MKQYTDDLLRMTDQEFEAWLKDDKKEFGISMSYEPADEIEFQNKVKRGEVLRKLEAAPKVEHEYHPEYIKQYDKDEKSQIDYEK